MNDNTLLVPLDREKVKTQIYEIRGHRVMINHDIAMYFGVETKTLNRARKRNQERFSDTFCFQLSEQEVSRCQSGTSMQTPDIRGGRTCLPYAYTEEHIFMLESTEICKLSRIFCFLRKQ